MSASFMRIQRLIVLGLTAFPVAAGAGGLAEPPAAPAAAAAPADEAADLYRKVVAPTFRKHCVACHGGDETEAEFDLTTRELLLKGGNRGAAVVAGKSAESLIVAMLRGTKKPRMPLDEEPLDDATIDAIARWIDAGAPFSEPLVAQDGPPAWTLKRIAPEARDHWAFRRWAEKPLADDRSNPIPVPQVANDAWCRNPIDRFILARLERAGLKPNPPAAPWQRLRRAHFDVTGLPPTLEELRAFPADADDDAWERTVDRLLDSPHYGERWGRHWLDLARFAESHGFEHDYDRPTAFHYRDFVIQALNQGMPFDRFVAWQIAGDELAPDDRLALMATGFLAAGVHSTQITKNEVEKHRYDELDDMLATIGTSMLGLTIGCARCHDHKYDPIPQRDYYGMLAAFTTTVRSEIEIDFDPEGHRQRLAVFEVAHRPYVERLAEFERNVLPGAFAEWERESGRPAADWILIEPEIASAGGATFTRQSDGSWLASGKNADHDRYTLTFSTQRTGITGLRIEALADPSFAKSGPGRADNGNFALSEVSVTAERLDGTDARKRPLVRPRATFEQQGLPAAAAVDDNASTAWAVDPEFGKDHALACDFEEAVGFAGGTKFTIVLRFNNNVRHSIGRLRLALTTQAGERRPDLRGTSIPETVLAVLETSAAERNETQRAQLLDWYKRQHPRWIELAKAEADHAATRPRPDLRKVLISSEGLPAVRLHTQGEDFFPETFFLRRGDPQLKDGRAEPAFLQALCSPGESLPSAAASPWHAEPPPGARTSFRRTALARWITDPEDGAGQLLARVIVNRLWQHHFGRGLVATPSDFGVRGAPPSHPELLDWLAAELIRHEWRLKPIHKLMLTSAAWQQSSQFDAAAQRVDPDNALCWRQPRRRLEAEAIRDAILSATGMLDRTAFGPGTLDPASRRRSIYFTVKRSQLMPMLQVFDCPDGLTSQGDRAATTIAPQALLLMNNAQIRQAARHLAQQLAGTDVRAGVETLYRRTLTRSADDEEQQFAAEFLAAQTQSYLAGGASADDARQHAWTDLCQTLLCTNEFVYLE